MWTGLLALIAAQSASGDIPPPPPMECGLPFAIQSVDRFSDLPMPIRADILKDGTVAEAGQDFNWGDAVLDRSLPFRRFVRAGKHRDMRWFVWLEHGGFDGHLDVLGYGRVQATMETFEWQRSAELSGEPCAATIALLSGVRSDAHRN